jgi:predicted RNA polymerase sigma factor
MAQRISRAERTAEAVRPTRQRAARIDHEEVAGLLALMLLHHARRPARIRPDGSLVPLAEQDRNLWDSRLIAEGIDVLQAALARDRLGEFQARAAIAALHADARTAEETDWVQIVEWYDELVRLTGSPVVAARLYAEAARSATNLAERDHLTRQAARLNAELRG